jgi:predicted GNAT family N-acyltransferase
MIIFRLAETKRDHGRCIAIRTLVFEVEQGVDLDLEVDEHEDTCRHILGLDDRKPFAAARWRRYRPGVAKIERVAVLKPWRGRNLGAALVEAVISDIKSAATGLETLRLEAQDYTIPFYEKLGFAVVSEGFLDANIPHHAMERPAGR